MVRGGSSRMDFGQRPRIDIARDQAELRRCLAAEQFSDWSDELLDALGTSPEVIEIHLSKLRLLDKYMERRSTLAPPCRDNVTRHHHQCLFDVFVATYERLAELHWNVEPPALVAPHPQPAPLPVMPSVQEIAREAARLVQDARGDLYIGERNR